MCQCLLFVYSPSACAISRYCNIKPAYVLTSHTSFIFANENSLIQHCLECDLFYLCIDLHPYGPCLFPDIRHSRINKWRLSISVIVNLWNFPIGFSMIFVSINPIQIFIIAIYQTENIWISCTWIYIYIYISDKTKEAAQF